jgi:hypothetical protein
MRLASAAAALVLAAGVVACGAGGSSSRVVPPGTCGSLIGKPVNAAATCSDAAGARGSFGCYPKRHQLQGRFYWISYPEDGSRTLAGRWGGVWYRVPPDWSIQQMAARIGC